MILKRTIIAVGSLVVLGDVAAAEDSCAPEQLQRGIDQRGHPCEFDMPRWNRHANVGLTCGTN